MAKKKEKPELTERDILNAHKACCPSWVGPREKKSYLDDGRCGSGSYECNGDCWYMKTFRKLLQI